MIDLDIPAPEVVLNDGLKRQIRIGADQIGGLAIKKAAVRGESIPQGTDHDQPQQLVRAGLAPLDRGDGFVFTVVVLARGPDSDRAPGNRVVLEQRFGSRSRVAVTSSSAAAGLFGR